MLAIIILLVAVTSFSVGNLISKRETINQPIDEMIDDFNTLMADGRVKAITVNDFSATFEKQMGFIKLEGSFTASNGVVKDLSSIQRTGDAMIDTTPTTATITLHLGFKHLEVYYKNYKANLGIIRVSGDMRLTARTSSVFLRWTFYFEDEKTCNTVLDRLYIDALDGIEVHVSNLGPLNWTYEKIVEWLLGMFKNEIQQQIEDSLTKMLSQKRVLDALCAYVRHL